MRRQKPPKLTKEKIGFDADGNALSGDALANCVREIAGDRLLLSFSMGKDSLATWLWLRERFNIIPYFLYWVPGLQFVEESLDYYEQFFGQHIIRLPHPLLYKLLRSFAYQPPERVGRLDSLRLVDYDFAFLDEILASEQQLGPDYFCAVGMRAADNLQRLRLIQQMGALGNIKRRYYFAIWDWKLEQVADLIMQSGVALPPDYAYWGRTLAAYDYQYLAPIRQHYPQDFERIRFWFPLIDAEMFRYESIPA